MDYYTVSPGRFAEQMAALAVAGWRTITLDALFETPPNPAARRVVLTFDDGFASNRAHAWPVLARWRFQATTFLVAERLGATNTWDKSTVPRYPLLGHEDVRAADRELMAFQSHSGTHRMLDRMDRDEIGREVRGSRLTLESMLAEPVRHFAYPFGAWDWRVLPMVRAAGYRTACSCIGGLNTPRTHPLLLRRVGVREEDRGWRLQLKLHTGRDLTGWPPGELEFLRAAGRAHGLRAFS